MGEPVAATPIKDLPPEVWKHIVSNLNEPELLNCRLVSKCWKDLSREVLRGRTSLWNITFGRAPRHGTRFSAPGQITRFMKEMKGTPNPFPNGTVIVIPCFLTDSEGVAFQNNLCKLLDTFKDTILNLVFLIGGSLREMDCDLSCEFRCILNLKRLKRLEIGIMPNWKYLAFLKSISGRNLFQEMLKSKEATLPEKLTELIIRGARGVIPLSYMFEGYESLLKSVSSLEIVNDFKNYKMKNPDERSDFPMCQFPNLKKLKVMFADAEFLQEFQQFKPGCVASLKEISLRFFESQPHARLEKNLVETLSLVDFHADTLELLHLDFGQFQKGCVFRMDPSQLFTPVKYTKVKTLVLQYDDIKRWPAVVRALLVKLVNLEELWLSSDEQICARDQYGKVVAIWDLLPTVKVIHALDYGWKIKRGETLQFDEAGNIVKMN